MLQSNFHLQALKARDAIHGFVSIPMVASHDLCVELYFTKIHKSIREIGGFIQSYANHRKS